MRSTCLKRTFRHRKVNFATNLCVNPLADPSSYSTNNLFSPSPPAHQADRSFEVEIPSLRLQRQAVYRELAEVCEKWGLVEMDKYRHSSRREPSSASTSSGTHYNESDARASAASPIPSEPCNDSLVLTLLNITTSAIRVAQRYFLTLPPVKLPNSTAGQRRTENSSSSSALGVVTASRPIPRHSTMGIASSSRRAVSPKSQKSSSSSVIDPASRDPMLRLRRVSLETLGMLRELDAKYCTQHQTQTSTHDLDASMNDISIASMDTSGTTNPSFHVDDTSASERSSHSDAIKGHLYRSDISLQDLNKEAQVVKGWIETVDDLLSQLSAEAKAPRPRTKSGHLSLDSSPLPKWANEDFYDGDGLGQSPLCISSICTTTQANFTIITTARVKSCIEAHLPADLLADLNNCHSAADLLSVLSDGQILCLAYNAVLRVSQRPWGFIPENSIHDVINLVRARERKEQADQHQNRASNEPATTSHLQVSGGSALMRRASSEGLSGDDAAEKGNKSRIGLTFRRHENLRLFVAALKLRYLIQINPRIDIKIIARKEEDWREMLEEVACTWVRAAAEEKRNEEVDSE